MFGKIVGMCFVDVCVSVDFFVFLYVILLCSVNVMDVSSEIEEV